MSKEEMKEVRRIHSLSEFFQSSLNLISFSPSIDALSQALSQLSCEEQIKDENAIKIDEHIKYDEFIAMPPSKEATSFSYFVCECWNRIGVHHTAVVELTKDGVSNYVNREYLLGSLPKIQSKLLMLESFNNILYYDPEVRLDLTSKENYIQLNPSSKPYLDSLMYSNGTGAHLSSQLREAKVEESSSQATSKDLSHWEEVERQVTSRILNQEEFDKQIKINSEENRHSHSIELQSSSRNESQHLSKKIISSPVKEPEIEFEKKKKTSSKTETHEKKYSKKIKQEEKIKDENISENNSSLIKTTLNFYEEENEFVEIKAEKIPNYCEDKEQEKVEFIESKNEIVEKYSHEKMSSPKRKNKFSSLHNKVEKILKDEKMGSRHETEVMKNESKVRMDANHLTEPREFSVSSPYKASKGYKKNHSVNELFKKSLVEIPATAEIKKRVTKLREIKEIKKHRLEQELLRINQEIVELNKKEKNYEERENNIKSMQEKDSPLRDNEGNEGSRIKIENNTKIEIENLGRYESRVKISDDFEAKVKAERLIKQLRSQRKSRLAAKHEEGVYIDSNIHQFMEELMRERYKHDEKTKQKKQLEIIDRMKQHEMRKIEEQQKKEETNRFLAQLKNYTPQSKEKDEKPQEIYIRQQIKAEKQNSDKLKEEQTKNEKKYSEPNKYLEIEKTEEIPPEIMNLAKKKAYLSKIRSFSIKKNRQDAYETALG